MLGALLASQKLLRWISKRALKTNPRNLGALTVSMLRGEEGNQRRSLEELVSWIERGPRPDIVHLSNVLFVGLARELKTRLGVPVVAGLQGAELEFDCASGRTTGAITPDAAGRFSVDGLHFPGHGGPIREDEERVELPARFEGTVRGTRMTISITLPAWATTLGPYTLVRGASPHVFKCL